MFLLYMCTRRLNFLALLKQSWKKLLKFMYRGHVLLFLLKGSVEKDKMIDSLFIKLVYACGLRVGFDIKAKGTSIK